MYIPIILATVVQFICGAIWYGPLFGKLWGKIHGFDKLPKEVQQKMMKEMGPFYAVQLIVTLITSMVFSSFVYYFPMFNVFTLASLAWIGFVVPAQVSAVIFGGTEPKWIITKMLLQAGGSLLCLEAAAAVFYFL